jgi:hypothetical protein
MTGVLIIVGIDEEVDVEIIMGGRQWEDCYFLIQPSVSNSSFKRLRCSGSTPAA